MVSAAKGAEPFYSLVGHETRRETLEQAREMDTITADVRELQLNLLFITLYILLNLRWLK